MSDREKLVFRADAENRSTVEVFLESSDGTRIKLNGVVDITASADDPFLQVTMFVDADVSIVLPAQTGELLKTVARLQAEVARLKAAHDVA